MVVVRPIVEKNLIPEAEWVLVAFLISFELWQKSLGEGPGGGLGSRLTGKAMSQVEKEARAQRREVRGRLRCLFCQVQAEEWCQECMRGFCEDCANV